MFIGFHASERIKLDLLWQFVRVNKIKARIFGFVCDRVNDLINELLITLFFVCKS